MRSQRPRRGTQPGLLATNLTFFPLSHVVKAGTAVLTTQNPFLLLSRFCVSSRRGDCGWGLIVKVPPGVLRASGPKYAVPCGATFVL